MPVTWDELDKAVKRGDEKRLMFTPVQALKRIARLGDLFARVLTLQQVLPAAFTEALAAGPPPKLSRWPRNSKSKDKSVREYAAKRNHARTPEPPAQPVTACPSVCRRRRKRPRSCYRRRSRRAGRCVTAP